MPYQTHSTIDSGHSTPPSDDEVLVRVEGVSKKFCRSLKKSLWYGVCDIAGELLPGRKRESQRTELTTKHTNFHEMGIAGGNQRADSSEFLEGHSQAGLQMDSEKLASIRSANDSRASGEQTGSASESVKFDSLDPSRLTLRADLRSLHLAPAPALDCDIRGKNSSSAPATSYSPLVTQKAAPSDWVYALKDVSFEVKRGGGAEEPKAWEG